MPITSLLYDKQYNPEAIEAARQISSEVQQRHYKWLVSSKFLLNQEVVDSTLSLQGKFCEDVIFDESERVTRNQRILLLCEQEKVKEKRQKIDNQQQTIGRVVKVVNRHAERLMAKHFTETPIEKLFHGGIPLFDHFSSFAYSPSLSLSKLHSLTTLSHHLATQVIDLANDPQFCERMGHRVRVVHDPKVATSQIGVENARLLFPVLMARSMLKWSDNNTKVMVPKLWQHMIVTANATRLRLENAGVKDPECGVLIGVLRTVSQFLIANHFSHLFDEALIAVMLKFREQDRREEYYACSDVLPSLAFLPDVLEATEARLTEKLINHFADWPANATHVRQAVLEDLNDIPLEQRSVYGVALAQAQSFSIYDNMSQSQIFIDKHKPYWFAHVKLAGPDLKELQSRKLGRFLLNL